MPETARDNRLSWRLAMVLYVAATASLGFLLIRIDPRFEAIWLTNAGVLAAILVVHPRKRRGLLALAFLTLFLCAFAFDGSVTKALALALVNLSEVAIACRLIELPPGRRVDLTNLRGLAQFLVATMGPAPMVSAAAISVFRLAAGEGKILQRAIEWQLAHALGYCVIVPLALAAYSRLVLRGEVLRIDVVETLFYGAVLLAMSAIVFAQPLPLIYLLVPVLCLSVFRTGLLGASMGALIVAVVAALLTVAGLGPIAAAQDEPSTRVLLLQLFIASCVLTVLPIAIILSERNRLTAILLGSEKRFRELAETAPIAICTINPDRHIVYANRGMARMSGRSIDELQGERLGVRLPEDARHAIEAALDESRASGHAANVPIRIDDYRGEGERWFQVRFAPLSGLDGDDAGWVCASTDVSQLRLSELRLEAQERELRLLADNLKDLICRIDRHGVIAYASQASARMFDVAADDLVGQSLFACIHPADRAPVGQAIADLASGSRAETRTFRWSRGAAEIWVEAVFRAVAMEGEAPQFVVAIRDVSERKAAEAAILASNVQLSETNRLLQMAEDLALVGHWHFAAATSSATWSRSVLAMHGLDTRHPPALDEYLDALAPRDAARLRAAIRATLEHGGGFERTIRTRSGHRGVRILEVRGTAELDGDGRICGVFGVCQDVTEPMKVQEDLRRARDAAMSAVETRSRFLAVMSHEIRTPMTGVLATFELLARHRDSIVWPIADMPRLIEATQAHARTLMTMLDNILDYAKLEAGKEELESRVFDPGIVMADTVDLFRSRAEAKGVALEIEEPGEFTVVGDPGRVHQILANLVSNAVKFTEKGAVVVRCEHPPGADSYRLQVADNGIGIAPQALKRILDPFAQADNSTNRRFGGTGLGLSIVHELVELMGGTLSIESAPGEGSVFRVDLPLHADRTAPAVPASKLPAMTMPAGLRVLVVDDTAATRLAAQAQLSALGCEVEGVAGGSEAIDALIAAPFDLVLVDSAMPGLDGAETIRLLRKLPGAKGNVPVLGFTAYSKGERQDDLLAAGACAILTKPFNEDMIRAGIAHALEWVPDEAPPDDEPNEFLTAFPPDVQQRLLAQCRHDLARFLAEFARPDQDLAARLAIVHSIKGVAGTFGYDAIHQLCELYEGLARIAPPSERVHDELCHAIEKSMTQPV